LPKRAEFHLAKRPLKEAEELLARGDYIKATEKAWAAAQIVKAAKKGKELKSAATRQRNSRRRQRRLGAAPTSPPRLLRAGRRPEM
jgi:hypothetical protein